MAFTTYADLLARIPEWLGGRTDLTANIPDCITLFEAWAARKLKVRPQETVATLTPASGSVNLPTDYLAWRRATVLSSSRKDLEYVHPSYLQALFPSGSSDIPAFFTIEGGALKTRSSDATQIEFLYAAKNAALSAALNWLYTSHPDAYLWGSIAEIGGFLRDVDLLSLGTAKRDGIFSEISLSNFREAGNLQIRVMGACP
jgi:hypothetical protein